MKAAVCTAYGPPEVLQVRDVPNPVPKAREVLIKIHASSVSASDTYIRDGGSVFPLPLWLLMRLVLGTRRPRKPILGLVLAGKVERAGKDVERFRAGDRVYGMTNLRLGAYAEYACLKETGTLARSPSNLTDDEAAALPYGGLLALHFLEKGGLRSGQRVLVYGASGAIGTAAIQIARIYGAQVTAACGPTNLDLVKALGAEAAIDYTRTSSPPGHFDLVLDAVGIRKTSALKVACRTALTPGGKYVSVDGGVPRMTRDHLAQLTAWAEAGKLKPVIDRRYPLDQIADAHRYVGQKHKKGNVIITVPHAVA